MASAILVNVKEEVTCPICLDFLREPLITDCGHTFCQDCITSNYNATTNREGESSCPVCRSSYQFETLRPNRQVVNIVARLKEFTLSPEETQKVDHCAHHGEKLLLFCEEDGKLICWLCERSREHRGHHTSLLEEVAKKYQEKLQATLEKLMKDKEELEKWEADLKEERSFWKNQIKDELQNVQAVFGQLRSILDSEERCELQKLKKEEAGILTSLAKSENELIQQSQLVNSLISDLEHRLLGSPKEMLQDVNAIMEKSGMLMLKKPETFPKDRRKFQAPDLKGMLRVFQELRDVQRYWVPLTLAPSNNPRIAVSQDQREIRYVYDWGGNYADTSHNYPEGVLGLPVITSGKHYWEVDVSKNRAWVLGLSDGKRCTTNIVSYNEPDWYSPPFSFKPAVSIYQNTNYQPKNGDWYSPPFSFKPAVSIHQNTNYQPKNGYWVIELQNEFKYNAFGECPNTGNPLILTLSVTVPPQRVGVFLDYEAGTLSFYNVTNHGFLIYKFSGCSFPHTVFPYFSVKQCPEPMTVCWPSS